MLMSCKSASSPSSWKILSIRPLSDHSLNRSYTVCHGPYRSGRSRQAAPLRAIQKMPFSISLGSRLGRPLSPICRSGNRALAAPIRHLSVCTVELFASSDLTSWNLFDVEPCFSLPYCIFSRSSTVFMLLETHSSAPEDLVCSEAGIQPIPNCIPRKNHRHAVMNKLYALRRFTCQGGKHKPVMLKAIDG